MEVAARVATIQRTAEGRRPAVLDARHRLQRDGVKAMTLTVCGPGVAEDVRHAGRVRGAHSQAMSNLFDRMVECAVHDTRGSGIGPCRLG